MSLVSVNEVPGATVINRSALRRLNGETVSVDMNVRMIPDLGRNLISLVVSCSYIAPIGMIRQRLLVSSVITTFEIDDLANNIVTHGSEVIVAGKLMMTMLSITVGALRGIVSVHTRNTALRHSPLPIIDLNALMARLNYGK